MAKTNKRRDEERRSAAAARVAELRRAQQAAERRKRAAVIAGVVVAVIVVVVAAALLIQNNRSTKHVAASVVNGANSNFGFVVGRSTAPVHVVAYEDFQCPICNEFEKAEGSTLTKLIDNGTISLEYRPIAFLDRMSSTNYSTRALNAAACVMNSANTDTFKKFHDLLYANQPAENGSGLPDSQLIAFAKQAGATSPQVASCITNQTFKAWTVNATNAAQAAPAMSKGLGTPTILVNGNTVALPTAFNTSQFTKVIQDAAKNKG
ncbi:MAG: DsbA family protein [Nocardioidaceae bacterium]